MQSVNQAAVSGVSDADTPRAACAPSCYNFPYSFKGAPPARQRRAGGPGRKQRTRSHRARMRDRDGHHHQDHSGGAEGQLADSGAAASRAPSGGSPTGAPPPPGQQARTRRSAVPAVTLRR